MASINTTMGLRQWVLLVTLSALWGGSFFFTGVIVSHLPPLTITALRVGLAAIALWVFAFSIGLRPPRRADIWLAFLGMAILNNVLPFYLTVTCNLKRTVALPVGAEVRDVA